MDSARPRRRQWCPRRRARRGRSQPPLVGEAPGAYQNLEYPGIYASPLQWNGAYPPYYGQGRSYAPNYPPGSSSSSSSEEYLPVRRRQPPGMAAGYVPPAVAGDAALMTAAAGGHRSRRGRSYSRNTYKRGMATPIPIAGGGQIRGMPVAAAYNQPVLADSYLPPPKDSCSWCPPRMAAAAAAYGQPVAPFPPPPPAVEETVVEETFLTSGDTKGRRSRNVEVEEEAVRNRPDFDAIPMAGAYVTAAAARDRPRKKKHHYHDHKSRYMAPEITLSKAYLVPAEDVHHKHKKKHHHHHHSRARVIGYISTDPDESSSSSSSSDSGGAECEMITWKTSTRPREEYVSSEEDVEAAARERNVRKVKKITRTRYGQASPVMQPAIQPPMYPSRRVRGYSQVGMVERGLNAPYPTAFPQGYGQEGVYANLPPQRGFPMPDLRGGNGQFGPGNAAALRGQRRIARPYR